MTKEKKKGHIPPIGGQAKHRHDHHNKFLRAQQHDFRVWSQLNALKEPAKIKHKSYFEAVDNVEKKKKLEFEIITSKEPPAGLEFVPTGYPELTTKCKELSREQGAMIFIVSDSKDATNLDHHMHRFGYHFRQTIVEEARKALERDGVSPQATALPQPGQPEAIPQSQHEINVQADAVLRDLFPRIPHTDRQEIITHAFQKNSKFNGEYKVGMATELPLARRVQLAALAHIRHTHTRYDKLLRETTWANARKAVEQACLDVIVKWRGDEETGRDQLDEILREVIEISDDEGVSDDDSSDAEAAPTIVPSRGRSADLGPGPGPGPADPTLVQGPGTDASMAAALTPGQLKRQTRKERKKARIEKKKAVQRYRRYAALADGPPSGSDAPGQAHPNAANAAVDAAPPDARPSPNEQHPAPLQAQRLEQEEYRPHFPSGVVVYPDSGFAEPRHNNGPAPARHIDAPARGQSPLFVRVRDGNAPKVGLPPPHTNGQMPLSPVRHRLEDMLLPSIEPRSPNGFRSHSNLAPGAPQALIDPSRGGNRAAMREVGGFATRPASPGNVAHAENLVSQPRRILTQYAAQPQPFSDAGFIRVVRVNRDGERGGRPVEYVSDRPPAPRTVAPSVYMERPRSPVIYTDDAAYPTREGSGRTRANPIVVGDSPRAPRATERVFETRGPPTLDYARPVRDTDYQREAVPAQEIHRDAGGARVVYLDDRDPRSRQFDNRGQGHVSYHRMPPQAERQFTSSSGGPVSRTLDAPQAQHVRYDDPYRGAQPNRGPVEVSSNSVRQPQPVPREVFYGNSWDGLAHRQDPLVQRAPPPQHPVHDARFQEDSLYRARITQRGAPPFHQPAYRPQPIHEGPERFRPY